MSDLRCQSKLHGQIIEPRIIEVKCNSKFCGAAPGVVVLHQFNTTTGELIATNRYKNPERKK